MKALRFSRNEGRYAAAVVASRLRAGAGAAVGPLSLIDDDAPDLPTEDWVRVYPRLAGICGSDLSTLDGHASRYFEDFVSFPFVPGHEDATDVAEALRTLAKHAGDVGAASWDPVYGPKIDELRRSVAEERRTLFDLFD